MKRKKILICCILAALLTIVTIIPIFAVTSDALLTTQPADLGAEVGASSPPANTNEFIKYYLYIDTTDKTDRVISPGTFKWDDNNTLTYSSLVTLTIENNILTLTSNDYYSTNSFLMFPKVTIDITNINELWIPCFALNGGLFKGNNPIKIYKSTTTNQSELLIQYYEMGHYDGYNEGFDEGLLEGQNIQQYTNLVGYVEQLIGQFTGSSAAQYITPIAIVLVVLFVYFLFIRFLLSLIKAKGIIKTCDIIMIVACIIMLVVMYAPMLDLTIKTEQINSSEETTEVVQINRSNIYVESTETGDIYHGPVGTAIVTRSETIEDVYKITKDIETEAIAYEKD